MKKLQLLGFIVILLLLITVGYSLMITRPKDTISTDNFHIDTLEVIDPLIESSQTKRDSVVAFAVQFLGTPYVYGSCNKDGFDCSGFIYYVFQHFKIEVPRSSSEYKEFGTPIDIDEVQKGDVLVFLSPTRDAIGHLGIVTTPDGMETEFIHSSSGKEMKVIYSSLKQDGYKKRFVKAVRVL